MTYTLKASKQFKKFYAQRSHKEQQAIDEKLQLLQKSPTNNPQLDIVPYEGEIDTYRLRYRKFRIIYRVKNELLIIFLIKAGSRGDIYK